MIHQMAMSPLAYSASAFRRLLAAAAMGTFMVTGMVLATTLVAPAQTVVAVVNGEPITALDVESRQRRAR